MLQYKSASANQSKYDIDRLITHLKHCFYIFNYHIFIPINQWFCEIINWNVDLVFRLISSENNDLKKVCPANYFSHYQIFYNKMHCFIFPTNFHLCPMNIISWTKWKTKDSTIQSNHKDYISQAWNGIICSNEKSLAKHDNDNLIDHLKQRHYYLITIFVTIVFIFDSTNRIQYLYWNWVHRQLNLNLSEYECYTITIIVLK